MNVPNSLSIFRLILIPVFCYAFIMGGQDIRFYMIAAAALLLSALSDVLDGFFARLLSQETELGKWLDPAADKTTLAAVCVCMWLRFREEVPELTFLFGLHILKELVMLTGGLILFSKEKIEPSHWWGKMATAVFYASMMLIMITAYTCADPALERTIILALAITSTAATLFALSKYIVLGVSIFKAQRAEAAKAHNN